MFFRRQQSASSPARNSTLLVALLLGACSSLPDNSSRIASHALAPDQTSTMVRDLKPLLDDHQGKSGFRTMMAGEEAFLARLKLIEFAERSLDLQYYIWHDDLTGLFIFNRLLEAADRGVRVRLLLDDLDTAGKDELLSNLDAHPDIEIRLFNPFASRSMRFADFVGDTYRVNRRMHIKTLTADSVATIFGGRNIGDEYFDATEEVAFGDMDALAIGPIAMEVGAQFDLYWNSEHTYPLAAFTAPDMAIDQTAFRKAADTFYDQAINSRYADIISQVAGVDAQTLTGIQYVWSEWSLDFDHPRAIEMDEILPETHLAAQVKEELDKANDELIIVSPYFVPGDTFTDYLVGRVEDGVRVRILTNSLQANDVSLVHAGYMRYRRALVEGGVELYEYRSTSNKVRRKMKRERIDVARTSLHAKFLCFDRSDLFIGSFNLDNRSVQINTELGAFYRSPSEAEMLSDSFDEIMRETAYRIEVDGQGGLVWIGYEDGQEIRLTKEPDTTWWKRVSTRVLSWIVPEAQL